jgi:hypothetical protein
VRREAAALVTSADMRCPPFSSCLVPPTCGVIPLFHSRFGVSYLIQIPKALRLQSQQIAGRFKLPKPPSAHTVYVRTRPQRGLAGVFAYPRPVFDALSDSTKRCSLLMAAGMIVLVSLLCSSEHHF